MKKMIVFVVSIVLLVTVTACSSPSISNSPSGTANEHIPTNTSVGVAWGGYMCEVGGKVYYVSSVYDASSDSRKSKILRMESDGTVFPISDEYYYISNLTSDETNIYFVVSYEDHETDSLYRVPINGGAEKKIMDGHFRDLQYMNKRLYWKDNYEPSGEITMDQTTEFTLKSMNSDGSDEKTLFSQTVPAGSGKSLDFLITEDALYYVISNFEKDTCDIFQMDLSGENKTKMNKKPLDEVDALFYDQGILYFLMQHWNGFSERLMWDSVETIDKNGKVKTVVKCIGYYPQDFGGIQYCGISDNIVYYFDLPSSDGSSEYLNMNLHQYDISKGKDTIILRDVDMGDGTSSSIRSLRGKNIESDGVFGMYILDNDIYFSPFTLP